MFEPTGCVYGGSQGGVGTRSAAFAWHWFPGICWESDEFGESGKPVISMGSGYLVL